MLGFQHLVIYFSAWKCNSNGFTDKLNLTSLTLIPSYKSHMGLFGHDANFLADNSEYSFAHCSNETVFIRCVITETFCSGGNCV